MTYDAASNAPRDALNAFRAVQDWHMRRATTRANLVTENLRRQEMTQRMQMLRQRMDLEQRGLEIRTMRAQTEAIERRQRMMFEQQEFREAPLAKLPPGMYVPDGKGGALQVVMPNGRPSTRPVTDPEELKKALEDIEQRRTRPEREMQQSQQRLDLQAQREESLQSYRQGRLDQGQQRLEDNKAYRDASLALKKELGAARKSGATSYNPVTVIGRMNSAIENATSRLLIADPDDETLIQDEIANYQSILNDAIRALKGATQARAKAQPKPEAPKLSPEDENRLIENLMKSRRISRSEAKKMLKAKLEGR